MKTKSEILEKYIHKTKYLSCLSSEVGKLAIFQAMEEYAEQLKNNQCDDFFHSLSTGSTTIRCPKCGKLKYE